MNVRIYSLKMDSEINSAWLVIKYFFYLLIMSMSKLYHLARIVAAVILMQTLYFKFWAHPESIELFTSIGMEPHGRIATWVIELIAWLVLLFGWWYIWLGALLWILLMVWAVYYHLTIIGINQLFWMAIITLLCCIYVLQHFHKESHNFSAFKDGMVEDE